jgi:DNA polymerase III epsilon subunit-like protein
VETTGLDPEQDGVCEIAYVTVSDATGQWQVTGDMGEQLVNPWKPIPPAGSAIHHIIDADVVSRASRQQFTASRILAKSSMSTWRTTPI